MKKPIPPCWDIEKNKDCPEREVGCSSNCERWETYAKKRDVYRKEVRKKLDKADVEMAYCRSTKEKLLRRSGIERN